MPQFFSFFIVLLAAVLFSTLFARLRVPWVVTLILGGIAIGPAGFDIFSPDATITFFAQIGLVFLMFMAGLETRFFESTDTPGLRGKILIVVLSSILIPAGVGIGVAYWFGYSTLTAFLLGIIFMASSIALLIPSLQKMGLFSTELGKIIIGASVIIDATALVLLSAFLQIYEGGTMFYALFFYPLLFGGLVILAWIIPKIRWALFSDYAEEQDLFERELRFVLLILIGLVVFFEFVGLHSIIAGFFAGLVLSRSIQSRILKAKLHAISYGFFIPVFFIVIGANTDIGILFQENGALALTLTVVCASLFSKFFSGYLAGRIIGFPSHKSAFLGASTAPSLSTTLAVAFLSFGEGIIDTELLTAVVALSVSTSVIVPIVVNILGRKLKDERVLVPEPKNPLKIG